MVINYVSYQQLRPSIETHIVDVTSNTPLVPHCMTTVHAHTTVWEGFTVENFMIQLNRYGSFGYICVSIWIKHVHGVPHDYHSTPLLCNVTRYVHITMATLQSTATLAEVVFTASRSDKLPQVHANYIKEIIHTSFSVQPKYVCITSLQTRGLGAHWHTL